MTGTSAYLAHEKWFEDLNPGADWSFAFSPLTLALLAAAVAVTIGWRFAARWLPQPELPVLAPLGRLVPFVPRLLGIHLGASLLALSARGQFLAPNLEAHSHAIVGWTLLGIQAVLGVWFVTGIRLRVPAVTLVIIGPAAVLFADLVALFEAIHLLGVALFLVLVPPSDATFGAVRPSFERLAAAILLLRLLLGASLITLGFSEKLANPDLARATLEAYPRLDVFALVGIDVPTDLFIRFAGVIEVLFGLLIISGALPQIVVLLAAVPFNATLLLFGSTELIGHLPVYGVFLALLVYGSGERTAAAVPGFAVPSLSLVRASREPPARSYAEP